MWNSPLLFNYSKSRDIQNSYQFHQDNLSKIYSRKHTQEKLPDRIPPNSKIANAKQLEINLENHHLLHKVSEIQSSKGKYNQESLQKFQFARKPNVNIEGRIRGIKKIMAENEFLENRLRTVPPTINSKSFEGSYFINQQYGSNIRKFNEKRSNGLLIHTTSTFSGSQYSEKKSKNFCIKSKSSARKTDISKEKNELTSEKKEKTQENHEENVGKEKNTAVTEENEKNGESNLNGGNAENEKKIEEQKKEETTNNRPEEDFDKNQIFDIQK